MSDRCHATNRQGQQCGRQSMLGGTVCDFHGGKAPRVRRKAKLRVAMTTLPASLVERGRRPEDVLLEALDRSAALMQQEGQPYYADAIRQAAAIAKAAMDAGVSLRLVALAEDEARASAALLLVVISDLSIGLDAETQRRIRVAMATRLRAELSMPPPRHEGVLAVSS